MLSKRVFEVTLCQIHIAYVVVRRRHVRVVVAVCITCGHLAWFQVPDTNLAGLGGSLEVLLKVWHIVVIVVVIPPCPGTTALLFHSVSYPQQGPQEGREETALPHHRTHRHRRHVVLVTPTAGEREGCRSGQEMLEGMDGRGEKETW